MITEFNTFINKPVISFDFDGVLHSDIIPGTIEPIDYASKTNWTPIKNIHKILKNEHNIGNKIIVVSSRGEDGFNYKTKEILNMKNFMWKFVKKYHLPVDEIILTNGRPKIKTLEENSVIRHYDDNIKMEEELKNTNIEFVFIQDDKIVKIIKNIKK